MADQSSKPIAAIQEADRVSAEVKAELSHSSVKAKAQIFNRQSTAISVKQPSMEIGEQVKNRSKWGSRFGSQFGSKFGSSVFSQQGSRGFQSPDVDQLEAMPESANLLSKGGETTPRGGNKISEMTAVFQRKATAESFVPRPQSVIKGVGGIRAMFESKATADGLHIPRDGRGTPRGTGGSVAKASPFGAFTLRKTGASITTMGTAGVAGPAGEAAGAAGGALDAPISPKTFPSQSMKQDSKSSGVDSDQPTKGGDDGDDVDLSAYSKGAIEIELLLRKKEIDMRKNKQSLVQAELQKASQAAAKGIIAAAKGIATAQNTTILGNIGASAVDKPPQDLRCSEIDVAGAGNRLNRDDSIGTGARNSEERSNGASKEDDLIVGTDMDGDFDMDAPLQLIQGVQPKIRDTLIAPADRRGDEDEDGYEPAPVSNRSSNINGNSSALRAQISPMGPLPSGAEPGLMRESSIDILHKRQIDQMKTAEKKEAAGVEERLSLPGNAGPVSRETALPRGSGDRTTNDTSVDSDKKKKRTSHHSNDDEEKRESHHEGRKSQHYNKAEDSNEGVMIGQGTVFMGNVGNMENSDVSRVDRMGNDSSTGGAPPTTVTSSSKKKNTSFAPDETTKTIPSIPVKKLWTKAIKSVGKTARFKDADHIAEKAWPSLKKLHMLKERTSAMKRSIIKPAGKRLSDQPNRKSGQEHAEKHDEYARGKKPPLTDATGYFVDVSLFEGRDQRENSTQNYKLKHKQSMRVGGLDSDAHGRSSGLDSDAHGRSRDELNDDPRPEKDLLEGGASDSGENHGVDKPKPTKGKGKLGMVRQGTGAFVGPQDDDHEEEKPRPRSQSKKTLNKFNMVRQGSSAFMQNMESGDHGRESMQNSGRDSRSSDMSHSFACTSAANAVVNTGRMTRADILYHINMAHGLPADHGTLYARDLELKNHHPYGDVHGHSTRILGSGYGYRGSVHSSGDHRGSVRGSVHTTDDGEGHHKKHHIVLGNVVKKKQAQQQEQDNNDGKKGLSTITIVVIVILSALVVGGIIGGVMWYLESQEPAADVVPSRRPARKRDAHPLNAGKKHRQHDMVRSTVLPNSPEHLEWTNEPNPSSANRSPGESQRNHFGNAAAAEMEQDLNAGAAVEAEVDGDLHKRLEDRDVDVDLIEVAKDEDLIEVEVISAAIEGDNDSVNDSLNAGAEELVNAHVEELAENMNAGTDSLAAVSKGIKSGPEDVSQGIEFDPVEIEVAREDTTQGTEPERQVSGRAKEFLAKNENTSSTENTPQSASFLAQKAGKEQRECSKEQDAGRTTQKRRTFLERTHENPDAQWLSSDGNGNLRKNIETKTTLEEETNPLEERKDSPFEEMADIPL